MEGEKERSCDVTEDDPEQRQLVVLDTDLVSETSDTGDADTRALIQPRHDSPGDDDDDQLIGASPTKHDMDTRQAAKSQRAMSLQDEQLLRGTLQGICQSSQLEPTREVDCLEDIFEPRPSTSSSPARFSSSTRSLSLAETEERRPSRLLLMPRTSQYEKHALLQERTDTGLSPFELFLQEKERLLANDRDSSNVSGHNNQTATGNQTTSDDNSRPPLIPRGAQYETHALLEKKPSGLSELELFLHEKELELNCSPTESRAKHELGLGFQGEKPKLEPRTSQYEVNALLETRDEHGLSPIDHLLLAKQEEAEKGKCSTRCTCKNAQCTNCRSESPQSPPRSSSTDGTEENTTTTRIEPKMSSKRVHFSRQGTDLTPDANQECPGEMVDAGQESSPVGEAPSSLVLPPADSPRDDTSPSKPAYLTNPSSNNDKTKKKNCSQKHKCVLS